MPVRSIPPLTMNTLLRRRASQTTIQERAAQLRQNLLALQESLGRLETSHRGEFSPERQPWQMSFGRSSRSLEPAPAFGNGRKQSYAAPARPPRPVDVLIPSRPAPNREPTEHTLTETEDATVINITFPVPVQSAEVRWERQGDVLEVEYLGKAFTYFNAFLVPASGEPGIEQEGRRLTFRFPSK